MVMITLQDLRFRTRQFLIAVAGAGLVFAMTLLLTGLAAGFRVEINQTVQGLGAQSWVLASGASGRIAALPTIPASAVSDVAAEPGVTRADPLLVVPQAAQVGTELRSVNLVGYRPNGLGSPSAGSGRGVTTSGEAVVDQRLHLGAGQHFSVSGRSFTVVGTVTGRTLVGGVPNAYVPVVDAQQAAFGGRPLVSAILTTGVPRTLPAGMAPFSNSQIETASLTQMASGVSSIESSRLFMWVIAVVILAALIYVTALERTRDFAVLKALGCSSWLLFLGLAIQAVLVALVAAAIAAIIANFMTGLFAQPVDIPASAFVTLPLLALAAGLVASLAALRRAVSTDPAIAFAGA
jgi:putative ABC transport system permease protein